MTPAVIISIHRDQLIVSCRGDFDLVAHPLLRGLGTQLTPTGPRGLVLNLSEVRILDCAGVRMLGQLMQAWLDSGREAIAVCPDGLVSHVLTLTGFSCEFPVVSTFLPADLTGEETQLRFLMRAAHAAS